MNSKTLLKVAAAFVILAAVLIFLGVNFVPRIFASSSNTQKEVASSLVVGRNSINDVSGASQLNRIGSDWIERNHYNIYVKSDYFERHPSNVYASSDWIERQRLGNNASSYQTERNFTNIYANSDYFERHPTNFYANSDWIERQP